MLKISHWMVFLVTAIVVFALTLLGTGCGEATKPEEGDKSPPGLSSVTPTDAGHIEVLFNEEVERAGAEHTQNYDIHHFGSVSPTAPGSLRSPMDYGDTLSVNSAVLLVDDKTVLLSVDPEMVEGYSYHLVASNIRDLNGNAMAEPDTMDFVGVATHDDTPPEIVDRSPAPDATGVGVGQSVVVTFSEPMDANSVRDAFSWTGPGGSVPYDAENWVSNVFIFTPRSPLEYGAQYTVGFAGNTATDYSSNYLAASSWSFTTTSTPDNTPPTLRSTTPADGATNVPLDIVFQLRFSEPIDPNSLTEVMVTPSVGDGSTTWTNGGKTLNFYPDGPLLAETTYYLMLPAGAVEDYAGNPLAGSYVVTFTTAANLPTGGFSGTISGDPNSVDAADPEGALVAAFMVNIVTWHGEEPPIGGGDIVDQDGNYEIEHLEDHTYWPIALTDTDGDGELNLDRGDAFGVYGVDIGSLVGEPEPDSVVISGGNKVNNVDFGLYDPIAIWGDVFYEGTAYQDDLEQYTFYAGVFDTTTFDPDNPDPTLGTEGRNIVWDHEFVINAFQDGLEDGTYYVGAFMDVDPRDGDGYKPGLDPVGFYEDGGQLVPVTVENGQDWGDIDIFLVDPEAGASQAMRTGAWTGPRTSGTSTRPEFRKAVDAIRRALEKQNRQNTGNR